MYPPPPPAQQHIHQPNQIIIQQDPSTAAALQQMAQLHHQHFKMSQNQMKALENIASASSFTSTVSCIPIYDGKDKDACTKWLQRCKEVSYYTGYNFRSAQLQRSSQDVAKVIWSLDKELTHDKLIEEIMCAFSGIPSTAAAIDELSHICQQPGQNFIININKYRDLHWWCTKKLTHEKTYKLTLSQFCSSLQDPVGRKLCKKLWDDKENHKLSNLQKCFDEAIRAYKQYRVTEHRRELEVFEASVEVNETTYHQKHANNPEWYAEAKMVKSTTEFINRTGNSAHIDEVELEALAELMDHPIKHIIHEINLFEVVTSSEIEESNKSCMQLSDLKPCYDPSEYYKDTETNSHVHEIYTTTIGYDTGTVFPIQVNGRTVRALLDTDAEKSCMNLDTYEKLKINCLNTSFMPTLKGATGHDMLTKGITMFDFTINEHTFTNSFIVCTKMSRPIILGRDFTIPNAISVGWTRHGTKKLCTDDKLVLETEENFGGKNTCTIQIHSHST